MLLFHFAFCLYLCFYFAFTSAFTFVVHLQVLTASVNFRDAPIEHKDKDGNVVSTETFRTCDTDHWHFWGATGGKSKKNDHVFFSSCFEFVIEHYKAELLRKGVTLRRVKAWTDNCPGQFGCAPTYANVAAGDENYALLLGQYFAEKYCYKSVVDGIGKVSMPVLAIDCINTFIIIVRSYFAAISRM
jgi:hypothetical protein